MSTIAAPPVALPQPSARTASPPAARLDFIDTLRGLAALWVVYYHVIGAYRDNTDSPNRVTSALVSVFSFGQVGVNLFLVVSGFCLFYPLARRAASARVTGAPLEPVRYGPFMLRRARRILPPYWAIVTLVTAWFWAYVHVFGPRIGSFPHLGAPKDRLDIVAHYLLVNNLFPRYIGSLATPFWSIALEWQLYLAFPLLVALARKRGLRAVLALTFAVALVWQFAVWFTYRPAVINDDAWATLATLYWSLPSRAFEFALGMASAYLVVQADARQAQFAGLVALACVVPACFAYRAYGMFSPLTNQIWGLVFAALIVFVAHATRTRPRLLAPLRPVTAVGAFSYSLYLIHIPLLSAAGKFIHDAQFSMTMTLVWFTLFGLPIALGYAYVWYCLFERPFLRAVTAGSATMRESEKKAAP